MSRSIIVVALAGAVLLACPLLPTPTPTPEPTATFTPVPPFPTGTPTATPTKTPTPVVVVITATPTATPSVPKLLENLYEVRDPSYFFGKIAEKYGSVPAMIDESGLWVEGGTKFRAFFYVDGRWHMATWAVVEGEWRWLGTEIVQPTPTPAPAVTPAAGREARRWQSASSF